MLLRAESHIASQPPICSSEKPSSSRRTTFPAGYQRSLFGPSHCISWFLKGKLIAHCSSQMHSSFDAQSPQPLLGLLTLTSPLQHSSWHCRPYISSGTRLKIQRQRELSLMLLERLPTRSAWRCSFISCSFRLWWRQEPHPPPSITTPLRLLTTYHPQPHKLSTSRSESILHWQTDTPKAITKNRFHKGGVSVHCRSLIGLDLGIGKMKRKY